MRLNKNFILFTLLFFMIPQPGSAIENGDVFPGSLPDYSGSFGSRKTLTGNRGVWRTGMAEKGLILSADIVTTYQNVFTGGIRNEGQGGGSVDLDLRMNLEKMGLWPGGFVQIFGETRYGNFVNSDTGGISSINADGLFPVSGQNETTLTSVTYYHYLSNRFCLFGGKLETLDRDFNAHASGRGKTQFLNQSLVFNPVTIRTVPYSAWGGGLFLITSEDKDILSLTVLDPDGKPNEFGLEDAFGRGATFMMEFQTSFHSKTATAHQLFGFTYGTRNYHLLDKNPLLMIPRIEDIDNGETGGGKDSWCVYFNYDQLLFDEKETPGEGFGFFLRIGYGDEDTNPVEWFYSFGLCTNGILESRANDTFGIGYYYINISEDLPGSHFDIDNEQGVEMYYNIEATPWLHITPDIQFVDPSTLYIDNAIAAGIRVKIDM